MKNPRIFIASMSGWLVGQFFEDVGGMIVHDEPGRRLGCLAAALVHAAMAVWGIKTLAHQEAARS